MKKNLGTVDRIIRIIILAIVGILYSMGVISGTLGITLLVIGVVLGLTSLIGFCPIYTLLGINSCPLKENK